MSSQIVEHLAEPYYRSRSLCGMRATAKGEFLRSLSGTDPYLVTPTSLSRVCGRCLKFAEGRDLYGLCRRDEVHPEYKVVPE